MHLQAVQPSQGGHLAALAVIERDDDQALVAPTGNRLFTRSLDQSSWQEQSVQWPPTIDDAGLGVFDKITQGMRDERLTSERYFAAHDRRLWVVATPQVGHPPVLLSSDETGRYWEVVGLPEPLEERNGRQNARPAGKSVLRLTTKDDELFIDDGTRLWRKSVGPEEVDLGELEWEEIDLAGVSSFGSKDAEATEQDQATEAQNRDLFPPRLRHYLPAADEDEAEFLTLYRRDLKIYRRAPGAEEFELAATLDTLDRHVVHKEAQGRLFLVGSDVVYRSDDDGSNWEELSIARDTLAAQDYRQLLVFDGSEEREDEGDDGDEADNEEGEEADEDTGSYELWLLGERGGLWRSYDGGEQWEEAVEHDPDGRGVTALVRENGTAMWAATEGRGVLRSDDGGQRWESSNEGLRASKSFDASLIDDGLIYVGTDAGLFERVVDEEAISRDWIDDRATSAIYWDHEQRRLIRGTTGGGIIVDADGDEETPELAPLSDDDVIEYLPPHLQGLQPEAASIIDLVPHAGTAEIVAWSHRRGLLISGDAGATWRRLEFGDAFHNAIEGSVITQFLSMAEQTFFAVTRTRDRRGPTQLWRSIDGGTTWQATHSFVESPQETSMQLIRLPRGQGVLRAHGSSMAVSTDLGDTWTSINGPWDEGQLLGLAVDDGQVVVVMELDHTAKIAWLDDLLDGGEVDRSHHLIWPTAEVSYRTRPVALQVRNEEVLLNEGGRIYSAQTPRRTTEGPAHVSALIGVGVVLLLTTLAFAYLRIWETS